MTLDRVLRQNFWIVTLGLLSSVAFVSARGVSATARLFVTPEVKELTAPPLMSRSLAGLGGEPRSTSIDALLARNPFDSAGGPLSRPSDKPAAEAENTPAGELDLSDPENAPACDGVKLLVVIASTDPDWSFASFQVGAEGKNVMARRGQEVAGKNVEFVGWDRAFLSSGRNLCQTRIFQPAGAPVPPPAPVASTTAPGKGTLDPSIANGIQKLSDTEFNIDRSVLDKILENQAELMRTARVVPDKEGDKVVGVRMFGIKSGSLLNLLGMENGDRLQTINGFDVSSPEKALEAYARLRAGADKLTVQINRRGTNTNLDYHIK